MTSADPPDGVWIDATGCTHLHGGEWPMLSLLSGHLTRHGLTGRVAIVNTPGAARALARYGSQTATVVEPGAQADTLALLPVAACRLDDATVDGLRRLELDLIGQLATTARGPLARTPRSPRPGHPPRRSRRHIQPGTIPRTWP